MPASEELTEWVAYLRLDGEVQQLIAKGTDPQLAYELVWERPDEQEA